MKFITGLRAGKTALLKLQLFANLDDIIAQNGQAFEGSNVKDSFAALNTKLGELGYDVLINNKKQAEFVPTSRLSEVVAQRDQFKGQLETLNAQLKAMEKAAANNPELLQQIQDQQAANANLLKDLENMKIQTEIFVAAKDAINPKDLMAFIDMNNIKVNGKGEILGVEAEIARLKTDKPYLFSEATTAKKKAGLDNGGASGGAQFNMNALIRRAAGKQ